MCLFGAASSPSCANYRLQHLANEYQHIYPSGSQFIMRHFYVDNRITSVENATGAIHLAKEACELCAKSGLRLHRFISKSKAVMENTPLSEHATNVQDRNLAFDNLPLERTLGIQWNLKSDCFSFSVNLKGQPATHRGILSPVASLYDPLAHRVTPFLLLGKRVLEEMCKNGAGCQPRTTPAGYRLN